MKLHLRKESEIETICGGRISGTKSTGKKQFFDVDLKWFESSPIKDRCVKCQAAYEQSRKEKA